MAEFLAPLTGIDPFSRVRPVMVVRNELGSMIFEDQLAALEADSKKVGTQGGDLDFYVDPVQAGDPRGRIVSGCSTPEPTGEWESTAIPDATPGEVLQPHESPLTTARFWP